VKYREIINKKVYFAVADLLNLEEEDEDGLRRYGHSKDHRADLPQILVPP
jgi:transposase